VLDAVRAARGLPGAGAGRSAVVFGHSQGGHAALFAGALAARYAPELDLLGVAAAAYG
jgi:pimeloyl-ACP methyl ester carboxylesterase